MEKKEKKTSKVSKTKDIPSKSVQKGTPKKSNSEVLEKKPTKKQDSIVKLEKTNQEEKEIIKETNIEEKATQEKKSITIGYVIKIIFLVITSPIWLPWRLLFVRRKGRKFNEVNTVTKVFRILRSPITKPLKFALFIFILVVEISLINKVRYSPITYTITRSSVHNYYLKEPNNNKLLSLTNDVYASELNKHHDEFKQAFDYIDEWSLSEKNKMYVILDSKAVKYVFKYAADEDITYLLTRFNTEENLRNDIKNLVSNINKLISRGLNETKELIGEESAEVKVFFSPFTSLGKTLDYTVFLNAVGNLIEVVESQSNPSTMKPNKKEDLDYMIDTIIKYSKGAKLKELGEFVQEDDEPIPSNKNIIITAN